MSSQHVSFVESLTADFWGNINIAPTIVGSFKPGEVESKIIYALRRLGPKNLRLLLSHRQIPFSPLDTAEKLAKVIVAHSDITTLFLLKEFARGRESQILKSFQLLKSSKAIEEEFENLPGRKTTETLKSFSKLLLLFFESEKGLIDIFFRFLSTKHTTFSTFSVNADIPPFTQEFGDELAVEFQKASRKGVFYSGCHQLSSGQTILLFFREYSPTAIKDFKGFFQVINRCGVLVVVFDPHRKTFQLKCKNSEIAVALERKLSTAFLETPVRLEDREEHYSFDACKEAILKDTDRQVKIASIGFNRSKTPGQAGIIITEAEFWNNSLSRSLACFNSSEELQFDRLSDVEFISCRFKGRECKILVEVPAEGYFTFRFDNAGWEPEEQEELEKQLKLEYGIPVNCRISPQNAGTDATGYIAYILGVKTRNEVQCYHRETYDQLLGEGIITENEQEVKVCESNFCTRIESDLDKALCPACGCELQNGTKTLIKRNGAEITKIVGQFLRNSNKHKLEPHGRKRKKKGAPPKADQAASTEDADIEGVYYTLEYDSQNIANTFTVIIADHLPKEKRRFFQKMGQPIILVQNDTSSSAYFRLDDDGIGRISLSHILAVQNDDIGYKEAISNCQNLLERCRAMYEESLLRAARISYGILNAPDAKVDGKEYERNIYNILRVLFPSAIKMGREGKPEPDGIIAIPDYLEVIMGNAEVSDVGSWVATYDAKETGDLRGYDLNIDERAKMVRYMDKFQRDISYFCGKNRKPRAHIIISNRIPEETLETIVSHVFGASGIKKEIRQKVILCFFEDEFLLRLYEWRAENHSLFIQLRLHFYAAILEALDNADGTMSRYLTEKDANGIISKLNSVDQPVEKMLSEKKALAAADDLTKKERPDIPVKRNLSQQKNIK